MAIPLGRFKFQDPTEGTAHEVMDPPLIAHCVTEFPLELVMYATLFATAIPYAPPKFQVTPVGTAHEVMDPPPLIAHCVTVLSP
jgi:hypothetical protein